MTSTQWVPPPARQRTEGAGLRVATAIGVVLTVGGGLVAFFLGALLPLGFYGDRDIPGGFSHGFDRYFHDSMLVAGVITLVLLGGALILLRLRPLLRHGAARAAGLACLAVAAATPWVWLVLAYANGKHFAQLYPY